MSLMPAFNVQEAATVENVIESDATATMRDGCAAVGVRCDEAADLIGPCWAARIRGRSANVIAAYHLCASGVIQPDRLAHSEEDYITENVRLGAGLDQTIVSLPDGGNWFKRDRLNTWTFAPSGVRACVQKAIREGAAANAAMVACWDARGRTGGFSGALVAAVATAAVVYYVTNR